MAKEQWPFYVYELSEGGQSQYVGKGSKTRLAHQIRAFGLSGVEIARFKREKDAYAFEIQAIAERQPKLNIHKGGNGSKAHKARQPRKTADERLMEQIGTRAYAARLILRFSVPDASIVERIREVAYG